MGILDAFTPKNAIFNALKDKLEGTGIIKLVLVFNIQTDKYNVMLSKKDNTSLKLDIQEDEITMVKKILINRIVKKYREDSDKEIKCVIIQVHIEEEDMKVFIMNNKEEVELFNY
jgi:hypothetical protein